MIKANANRYTFVLGKSSMTSNERTVEQWKSNGSTGKKWLPKR
jgi:hypothetical protein